MALEALSRRIVACQRCPRLVEHRERVAREKKRAYWDWTYWGKPVPGFGDPQARVVILGLAPGAHGANRTGRIFTGDPTARFLIAALYATGFANRPTSERREDGLQIKDAYLTASVKCVPPADHPTRGEMASCLSYLAEELRALQDARVVVALGRLAFDSFLRYASLATGRRVRVTFQHGGRYDLGPGLPLLLASYHPSPRNTLTGRLTQESLISILQRARGQASLNEMRCSDPC